MPRYDYQCVTCSMVQEITWPLDKYSDYLILSCDHCGLARVHGIVVLAAPGVEPWAKGRLFEDLAPKGVTFHSKGEYKRYLKERGIVEWSPKTGMPGSGV